MIQETPVTRNIGLFGAVSLGVGAIVGGGILALAGVAFSITGPSAIVAFALNGIIALVTALSFAEMSAAFPESGGTYTFARKILSVRAAFAVGWVVCFASLAAAVLYAIGFGSFAAIACQESAPVLFSKTPSWVMSPWLARAFAFGATFWFCLGLLRGSGGGGQWINMAKVLAFAVVIGGGCWALTRQSWDQISPHLIPFLPAGSAGLFQAMGFTFIALQGFDLVAAVAGEIKDPGRTIPRAMILSLGAALMVYLPLLLVLCTVGVPEGETIVTMSRKQPEAVVALGSQQFLGPFGYWLIIAAGILSMLSALQANLFAASRIAFAMARDRTLSPILVDLHPQRGIPRLAVITVSSVVLLVLLFVPDVATAGAASSLIFLITFALAHYLNILFRNRIPTERLPFRVPLFPLLPVVGGVTCLALSLYQGVTVPMAGIITVGWLILGAVLYTVRFSSRATAFDASTEATDLDLLKYRGRSPLVLVPLNDATNAVALVRLAHAIAPPDSGNVMLFSVVEPPAEMNAAEPSASLLSSEVIAHEALSAAFATGLRPEALMRISTDRWPEIIRVARFYHCESILLELRNLTEQARDPLLAHFLAAAPCDVVMLRVKEGWHFKEMHRVLIPLGGRGKHSALRARLLGSMRRSQPLEVTYLCVLPLVADAAAERTAWQVLQHRCEDEMNGLAETVVVRGANSVQEIVRRSADYDLVVLGLHFTSRRRLAIGDFSVHIAEGTDRPLLILGHKLYKGVTDSIRNPFDFR